MGHQCVEHVGSSQFQASDGPLWEMNGLAQISMTVLRHMRQQHEQSFVPFNLRGFVNQRRRAQEHAEPAHVIIPHLIDLMCHAYRHAKSQEPASKVQD
eukprot:1160769-Pelagomonas_calceolata.AAC.9